MRSVSQGLQPSDSAPDKSRSCLGRAWRARLSGEEKRKLYSKLQARAGGSRCLHSSRVPRGQMRDRGTEEAWCVHNDPCGLCCVGFTYGLIFFADYGMPLLASRAHNNGTLSRTHAHSTHPPRPGSVRQLWSLRCCCRGAASPRTFSCTRLHSSPSRCWR